ncbi:hypothetical protein V1522DRAFT_356659, partial [Lipomyces starkeyi]
PTNVNRKVAIVDAIIPKNIPTTIFQEMAPMYIRRAEILSKGFNLNYLTPMGKQRNRGRPKGRVKRPLNSFMIYRRVQAYLFRASSCDEDIGGIVKYKSSVHGYLERISHQSVSVIIGQFWRTESQTVRDAFTKLAKQESSLHRELHPDYKYCPQKKTQKSPRISSSGSTLSRSHKPSKLSPICQPLRLSLPNEDCPKLIEHGDYRTLPHSKLDPRETSTSSPIFTPGVSPEDPTLPATLDYIWATISHYGWSDASSTPAPTPDYKCMEQIPLCWSPSEELNRRNRPTVRIAEYDCGTEGQYNGGDEVQIGTSLEGPSFPVSRLPINHLPQTRTSYSVNAVSGSGDLEMNEVNTNLSESVGTNAPSPAQYLMGSLNGLEDMAIEADEYDDIEQAFKSGSNMRTGNNYCLQVCN